MAWSVLFIAFTLRGFGIGIFGGSLQYAGLVLIAVGIILREWSIWVLGKYFTGQVQVREKAKLVTNGPYRYIRHPSYTGGMLSLIGITLAIGTWFGALVAFVLSLIAYQYRIHGLFEGFLRPSELHPQIIYEVTLILVSYYMVWISAYYPKFMP